MKYRIQTKVKCIVRYDYVVEADNYFEAVKTFVNDDCPEYLDYDIEEDIETIEIITQKIEGENK